MSNANPQNPTQQELPRLRIHHFFVLTTVFAVVMSVWLGIWKLFRSCKSSQAVPEITTEVSLFVAVQSLSLSACAAVALLGLAWRKRGISFPCQPGHWIAIYLTIAWALESALLVSSLFLPSPAIIFWVRISLNLAFHCFAFALWGAAYLHEPARIWKLGWAALAFKPLLAVLLMLFFIGARCIEWLLELFWYHIDISWGFSFFSWGRYDNFISLLLANYLLLAFLLAATIIDFRQHRLRHWSHWLVVVSTFVSTVIMTVYYHFALR